jgi:sulfate adenylyltransferase subunit 2
LRRAKTSALAVGPEKQKPSADCTFNHTITKETRMSALTSQDEFEILAGRSHLDRLEAEAITIIREVVAGCESPVLLFSGGKDSAVLLWLALKAFSPARLPFPVMHVDTGHNFPEVIEYRDEFVRKYNLELVVASVQESIDKGDIPDPGPTGSRNRQQAVTLLTAIRSNKFDAAFGGGRRDEDKARAKERILSFRDKKGGWEPRLQRPEPWNILNPRIVKGEHLRAFPISNWTELDIWEYIAREDIALPTIYFSHERTVIERDNMLLSVGGPVVVEEGEVPAKRIVRYRTVGDMSCTGAIASTAANYADVLAEVATARITERGATRADDNFSESAMEDRKREGYF